SRGGRADSESFGEDATVAAGDGAVEYEPRGGSADRQRVALLAIVAVAIESAGATEARMPTIVQPPSLKLLPSTAPSQQSPSLKQAPRLADDSSSFRSTLHEVQSRPRPEPREERSEHEQSSKPAAPTAKKTA